MAQSKMPQLNMRTPQQTIDRVDRLRDLLAELRGHPHGRPDAVGYAVTVALRVVEQELALARRFAPGPGSAPACRQARPPATDGQEVRPAHPRGDIVDPGSSGRTPTTRRGRQISGADFFSIITMIPVRMTGRGRRVGLWEWSTT